MIKSLAALALTAAVSVSTLTVTAPAEAAWHQPYGGCKEARHYPDSAGFRSCVRHGLAHAPSRPCQQEDSSWCVWVASGPQHSGNGRGRSFWSGPGPEGEGTVHYVSARFARYLLNGSHR
jgi:hypothetical protein